MQKNITESLFLLTKRYKIEKQMHLKKYYGDFYYEKKYKNVLKNYLLTVILTITLRLKTVKKGAVANSEK